MDREATTSTGALAISPELTRGTPHHELRTRLDERICARDALLRRALASADALSVLAALLLAATGSATSLRWGALALPIAFVSMSKIARLYDNDGLQLRRSGLDEVPPIFVLSGLLALFCCLAGSTFVSGDFDQAHVAVLWGAALVTVLMARAGSVSSFAPLAPPNDACSWGAARSGAASSRACRCGETSRSPRTSRSATARPR